MLLGLDLGTSSAKAVLLAPDGRILGEGVAPYAVHTPQPGWAESNPDDWWTAAVGAVRQAAAGRSREIGGLGLSGQMHGVVLTAADGLPLRPAILWADTRSTAQLEAFHHLGVEARRRLANPYTTGMAGPWTLAFDNRKIEENWLISRTVEVRQHPYHTEVSQCPSIPPLPHSLPRS